MSAPATTRPAPWPSVPAVSLGAWAGVTRLKRTAVLAVFLLAYLTMQVASYTQKSATYDEPIHLAAGYAALAKHDYRMDPTHPPLVRMWAALPLLGMDGVGIETGEIDGLRQFPWLARGYTHAHDFLYNGRDADHLLYWARFMIVLLGAGLGLLVFCWAEEWLGFPAAVIALGGYLLSPNLAAHAALVTTDLGLAAFFFATVYFLWRTGRAWTAGNVAGLALSFAAAMVTKFSALLLVPTGIVLLAFAVWRVPAMTWRRAAGLGLLLAATAWVAIWAVYGFRYAPSATAGWLFDMSAVPEVTQQLPVIAPLLHWVDGHHLLPNAYSQGFLVSYTSAEMMPAYLAGDVRLGGWWYYFPVAFLVKTPVSLLVLLLAGVGVLLVRRTVLGLGHIVCVLVPPAIFLGGAMATHINIGLRHILPVYPFVLLIAAAAAREVLAAAWRTRTKALVLGSLAALWLAVFVSVYPFTLTFFNLFAGGPAGGDDYLADSNLDWGQHLKRLKRWMVRHDVAHINLAYFGMADPAYYGIDCTYLPGALDFMAERVGRPELPGYVAIGSTVLSGAYLAPEWRLFYGGFDDLEPVAVIGNALRIYRIDHWPEAAPDADGPPDDDDIAQQLLLGGRLTQLGWHEHAILHYRQYAQLRPNDAKAHGVLAEALLATGHAGEAVAEFRRAVELNPRAAEPRDRLVGALLHAEDFRGAIAAARQLVAMEPGSARAQDLLGVALANAGRLAEAETAFTAARTLDPEDELIRRHLAQVRTARAGGAPPGPRRRR